jgi:5'-nucleotidase
VRALITNDDGIDSDGIRALAQVAVDAGLDTTIAAPSWDSSGAAASLTAVERDGRFLLEARDVPGLDGVRAFAAEAAPAFIVRAANTGAFGAPPDIVLSGINRGPNTGHAVLHSGTVGAALTASTFGLPALAVSLDIRSSSAHCHWATASAVARVALRWLLDAGDAVVLNVNAPNCRLDELGGIRTARLAAFGAVQTIVTEQGAGYVKLAYDEIDADLEPGTDAAALAEGVATVTSLRAVCEERDAGLPDSFDLDRR